MKSAVEVMLRDETSGVKNILDATCEYYGTFITMREKIKPEPFSCELKDLNSQDSVKVVCRRGVISHTAEIDLRSRDTQRSICVNAKRFILFPDFIIDTANANSLWSPRLETSATMRYIRAAMKRDFEGRKDFVLKKKFRDETVKDYIGSDGAYYYFCVSGMFRIHIWKRRIVLNAHFYYRLHQTIALEKEMLCSETKKKTGIRSSSAKKSSQRKYLILLNSSWHFLRKVILLLATARV